MCKSFVFFLFDFHILNPFWLHISFICLRCLHDFIVAAVKRCAHPPTPLCWRKLLRAVFLCCCCRRYCWLTVFIIIILVGWIQLKALFDVVVIPFNWHNWFVFSFIGSTFVGFFFSNKFPSALHRNGPPLPVAAAARFPPSFVVNLSYFWLHLSLGFCVIFISLSCF